MPGMRGKVRVAAGLVFGLAVAIGLKGAAPPAPSAAKPPAAKPPAGSATQCRNQAPRALAGVAWDRRAASSLAQNVTENSLTYRGRTLRLCSQHYHCQIETFQGCDGQSVSPTEGPPECPLPPPGSWVEVHRAYAAKSLCIGPVSSCCVEAPFVVLGFHAKVAEGDGPGKLPLFRDPPFAEFSGSTTGPAHLEEPPSAKAGACKPAAQWSFTLNCDLKVWKNQLDEHGEGARPLQRDVSRDLTLVRRP